MKQKQNTVSHPMQLLSRNLSRIRVAVAGLGKMGTYHVQALQRLAKGESEEYYKSGLGDQIGKLELCGLCEPCTEKTRRIATGIPCFTDWQELLAKAKPALAIIASPTRTHFPLTLMSLQAGVHTFVEKPLVTRLDEFLRLSEVADAQGCRLMSGHVERYNPVAIKLRSMIVAEQINALNYRFRRSQPHDVRISDDIVTDKIVHDLDLAQYFFGDIADYRLLNSKQADGLTQEATVLLRHVNGAEGTLFVSWLLPDTGQCREVRITCRNGAAVVGDFAGKALRINGQLISCAVPAWIKPDNNQIKDELADFIAYCMESEPDMPVFQPLLQTREIETSIAIIETLIKNTEKVNYDKI